MVCKNCGSTIEENAKFCENCGTAVSEAEVETPVAEAAQNAEYDTENAPEEAVVTEAAEEIVEGEVIAEEAVVTEAAVEEAVVEEKASPEETVAPEQNVQQAIPEPPHYTQQPQDVQYVQQPQVVYVQQDYTAGNDPRKSKVAAGLLGIFLGSFGVHNFYLGYTTKAIIQVSVTGGCILLSLCTVGLSMFGMVGISIWGLIEGIMILAGSIKTDGKGIPLKD